MVWNMRLLFLSMLMWVLPVDLWSASFTSKASGNWSSPGQTTWNEVGIPDTGDSVVINTGHAVIVDTNTAEVASVVVIGHNVAPASLIVNAKLSTATLTIGNNDSTTMATLTSGPGSEIAISGNILINAATWNSTSTPGAWGKVTGSGSINSTPSVRRQSYDLQYVSFQNTGAIKFVAGGFGVLTNSINIRNCVFSETGTIQFGEPTYLNTTEALKVSNCDFESTGNITVTGKSGTPNEINNEFKNNTLKNTTSTFKTITFNGRQDVDIDSTVFYGFVHALGSTAHPAWKNNFFAYNANQTSGASNGLIGTTITGASVDSVYMYIPQTVINPHVVSINVSSGIGGFTNNIVEMYGAVGADGGNVIVFNGNSEYTCTGNLHIGSGATFNVVGTTTPNVTLTNNTSVITSSNSWELPTAFWLSENGGTSGALKIKSNLIVGLTTPANYFIRDDGVGADQVVAEYGYNNIFNTATTLSNITISLNLGGDVDYNPQFYQTSRKLATWNGNTTDTQSIDNLLGINGYNTTMKNQSSTPSGVSVAGLIGWVRAGFAPTNSALKTAGEGGTYIGAVDVVSLGSPSALMVQ